MLLLTPICPRLAALLVLACTVTGCDRKPLPLGPTIVVVDSTSIVEGGNVMIGPSASFIARAADGRTFVNDATNHRVLEFSSKGEFAGVFGRAGSGPGELESPASIGLVGHDSVLVVADWGRRALVLYEVQSGQYLRTVPIPAQDIGQNWVRRGDTVEFALGLGRAFLGRWIWTRDTAVAGVGAPPAHLVRNTGIAIRYGRSDIAEHDSGFVTLLPTDPGLRLLGKNGSEAGFVRIPNIRRLGEPADLFKPRQASPAERFKPRASSADGLHRTASGEYVLAHLDLDFIGTPPTGRFGNFRLFVTIVSGDLARACIDAPIHLATDVPPIPIFLGDTLFVLTRSVLADDKVRTMIRGFLPTTAGCEWIPLVRSPTGPE